METKTKVIFRLWKNDVIAIFPEEMGDCDLGTCMSYMHIGQHGSCNPYGIVENSKLATEEQYANLKIELESIGYDLQVIKRLRYAHLETRKNKLDKMRE